MLDITLLSSNIVWPLVLLLAWILGEFGSRFIRLPRITVYGLVGFLFASGQMGFLPSVTPAVMLQIANVAFGLILFELGYRINMRWLLVNPWIGIMGIAEAVLTFSAVYFIAINFGMSTLSALLLASLVMSTSPAGVLCVINEQRSSGQVTERILHLSAINCILAVFTFKVIVGFSLFQNSGNLWETASMSLRVLLISAALGAGLGMVIPSIMRRLGTWGRDGTVIIALAIILLVAITHDAKLSPVLAALIFGLTVRHRRVSLSQTQPNFGALGELLAVLLFVYVLSTLEWSKIWAGAGLALLLIAVRVITKMSSVTILSRVSGISMYKGFLTGLALAPISVFVILVLEQVRDLGIGFVDQLAVLGMMTLLMELLGPVATQYALIWAKETSNQTEV